MRKMGARRLGYSSTVANGNSQLIYFSTKSECFAWDKPCPLPSPPPLLSPWPTFSLANNNNNATASKSTFYSAPYPSTTSVPQFCNLLPKHSPTGVLNGQSGRRPPSSWGCLVTTAQTATVPASGSDQDWLGRRRKRRWRRLLGAQFMPESMLFSRSNFVGPSCLRRPEGEKQRDRREGSERKSPSQEQGHPPNDRRLQTSIIQ